jgi:hypothetical protein
LALRPPVTESNNGSAAPERPSLDAIAWPVRTDRLTLQPPARDDLEATWQFRRLDDVSCWRLSFEDLGLRRVTANYFAEEWPGTA